MGVDVIGEYQNSLLMSVHPVYSGAARKLTTQGRDMLTELEKASREARRCAERLANAQGKIEAERAKLEAAILIMRAEGASLSVIAEAANLSRTGVVKALARNGAS